MTRIVSSSLDQSHKPFFFFKETFGNVQRLIIYSLNNLFIYTNVPFCFCLALFIFVDVKIM